ncbi:MAG: sulfotransferase [Anaerolineales bacterium]|nr:sulfotransferase [Anaerolineales bacterium]
MIQRIKDRLFATWQVFLHGPSGINEKRSLPQITEEEAQEARCFFPLDKFFIFGHARSGTTLLARLVGVHPDVLCNWQAHFFTRPPLLSGLMDSEEVRTWMARQSNRWNRGKDMSTVVLRAMSDFILEREARRVNARVVGDKSPNVLLDGKAVEEMVTFYPDGKLIYIVRDGRDTLVSHRFQNFIDGAQFLPPEDLRIRDDFEKDPDPFFEGQRSIFTEKAIVRMAEGWVRNVLETDRNGKKLFGDRYHVLRYEDLLASPFERIAALWRFLDLDPSGMESLVAQEMVTNPDAAYQKQKAANLVQGLERGKKGKWQQLFTERDKQIFKEIAGQTLIDWQYEKDMDW